MSDHVEEYVSSERCSWSFEHSALFEYKVILTTLLKNYEFIDTGANIVTQFSSTLQPYVEGRKWEGPQIPLLVREIAA